MNTNEYFTDLKNQVDKVYAVASLARAKGLDPEDHIEMPIAMTMAEKCVQLVVTIYPQLANCGVDKRILELEKEFGKLDPTVVFKIGEEVAKQNFCNFKNQLEAIDAGVRIGFAYITLGVVSSPIEGYTGIKLRKTKDGKDYFEASFSGPIRSAGTTSTCLVLILIDYLREMFGYARYDPSDDEVRRVVTELGDFYSKVANLQYMPSEEEIVFLASHMPIQVAGDPSEKLEVSNYKSLERVDTNFLRSGFCLVFAEGLSQKASKAFRLLKKAKANGIESTGFDFLGEYVELHEKTLAGKSKSNSGGATYIKDLVGGRPIFGHPCRSGAFRMRYGRCRASGFSAAGVHPATMGISDNFIAIGTQLKLEKPTKGCVATVCDSIDGPIVKLADGSVRKLNSKEEARKLYKDVEEIIYLGDILIPFSDVLNRNANLVKPGYVEEWWALELLESKNSAEFLDSKSSGSGESRVGSGMSVVGSRESTTEQLRTKSVDCFNVSFAEAIKISKEYGVPLHPKFIFYWNQIDKKQFSNFIEWVRTAKAVRGRIILSFDKTFQEKFSQGKRCLELLGVPHEVDGENVVIAEGESKALLCNLGIETLILEGESSLCEAINLEKFQFSNSENSEESLNEGEEVLKLINKVCDFVVKDKAGDFVGARMGRPEKAKLRQIPGSPNALFPLGGNGGRLNSIQCAVEKARGDNEINDCFEEAKKKLGYKDEELPTLIKGVKRLFSKEKISENLSKGILRAKYGLQVNKDGTVRFDMTELPLTHFKSKEIGVGIEKLRELGYLQDYNGKDLMSDEQILELKPHDVLLPSPSDSPDSSDGKGDDVFIRICNFADELLVKFYGLDAFYNVKSRGDLVGKLGMCMAPHNCAGVVCRFIGFSNTQGMMASPYMHAAIRRDCDGDEASYMLLGDVLLNFSKKFLPSHRGGTQDAPLVLNAKINAGEVDDQILDLEMVSQYPLELYSFAEERRHSSQVKMRLVSDVLKKGEDPFVGVGFTHGTSDFNDGVVCSSYKTLGTMKEKVEYQMRLCGKIRAVDQSDTARLVIERHFIPDIKGNLDKFSMQEFRCVACNEIFRRVPISGVCTRCKGKIIFTIHEGGIKKYLRPAIDLAEEYNLSDYLKERLRLLEMEINQIFGD